MSSSSTHSRSSGISSRSLLVAALFVPVALVSIADACHIAPPTDCSAGKPGQIKYTNGNGNGNVNGNGNGNGNGQNSQPVVSRPDEHTQPAFSKPSDVNSQTGGFTGFSSRPAKEISMNTGGQGGSSLLHTRPGDSQSSLIQTGGAGTGTGISMPYNSGSSTGAQLSAGVSTTTSRSSLASSTGTALQTGGQGVQSNSASLGSSINSMPSAISQTAPVSGGGALAGSLPLPSAISSVPAIPMGHGPISTNNSLTSQYSQWSSTSIYLMIGSQTSGALVATLGLNVDVSDERGSFDFPQTPYLTCYGNSYFYKFVSKTGAITYSDQFSISYEASLQEEKTNATYSKQCQAAKVIDSPRGKSWSKVENGIYGYNVVQNITNIYNQVITTVSGGQTVTVTKPTTAFATMTASGSTRTISQVQTVTEQHTNIVTSGGSTFSSAVPTTLVSTKIATVVGSATIGTAPAPVVSGGGALASSLPVPSSIPAPSGTALAPSGTEPAVSAAVSDSAAAPQPSSPTKSECSYSDWDESCEDWEPGTGASASPSATAGAGLPGSVSDSGTSGKPSASWLTSSLVAVVAVAAGGMLVMF